MDFDVDSEEEGESDSEAESEAGADSDADTESGGGGEDRGAAASGEDAAPVPVQVTVRTALASPLIDQRLELTAASTRTVAQLRQSVSRTMRGRPPLACVRLRHRGRAVAEDETVADLLREREEDDDDDDDAEEEEDDDGERGEEDAVRLTLTCDAVPPIDARFGVDLRERLATASAREILDAYCANAAGAAYVQELMLRENARYAAAGADDEEDEDGESDREDRAEDHALHLQRRATLVKAQLRSTLSDETLRRMEEEHDRVRRHRAADAAGSGEAAASAVYGLVPPGGGEREGRGGGKRRGGAAMTVKRSLQRNLNVVRARVLARAFYCGCGGWRVATASAAVPWAVYRMSCMRHQA